MNTHKMERWVTAVGGGTLAMYGMRRRDRAGLVLATLGGVVVYRAVANGSARAMAREGQHGDGRRTIRVERSVTINADALRLYEFWRQLSRLPDIMRHLTSVTELSPTQSRWVARGPAGSHIEWEAEIVDDRPGEAIGWRSLPGADVTNAGTVQFRPAPDHRGTEVHVCLTYDPPMGRAAATVAKLLGEEPDVQVREDLRRFKWIIEAGELPTIDGQPHGS